MNVLLLLLACGTDDDAPGVTDGMLPFAEFPACELGAAGTALDLEGRCVNGACAGMTYEEFVAALGEPDDCDPSYSTRVTCTWRDGLRVFFDDEDDDEVPDAGSTGDNVYVQEEFSGTDPSGLGTGMSMGCFVEAFGLAEELSVELLADAYHVTELEFEALGLMIADWEGPDGICDEIVLRD